MPAREAGRSAWAAAFVLAPVPARAPAAEWPVHPLEVSARWVPALPRAAEHAAEQAAAVLLDAAAAALPDAEVVVALPDAAAEEVGAAPAEGAAVVEPAAPGALPSALPWAWASRQDPLPPWPAPRPWVQIARAMELSPIAWL